MNKTIKKYISLFLILSLCTFSLSGCFNENNIDHLAYVVALGFDVSDSNNLKLSFQLSTPSGSSSGGGTSSQSDSSVVNTIECSSIDSGINLLNSYISKKINLSHCKVFVFSEEFASKGISKEIYTLMNDIEVRPDSNVIISRCNAEYFLKNSKPLLEQLSARYYEIAPSAYEYTGYTEDISLSTFFATLNDPTRACSAILGGVNPSNITNPDGSTSNNAKDSSYVADETPISSTKNSIENLGLAVFVDDKLVGELNAIETLCHLIINNKMKTCIISIPNPFNNADTIDLSLQPKKKTKNTVTLVNGSPYITSKISLFATIYTMDENSKNLNQENLDLIEKYANSYLSDQILQYLYRTSKVLKSDVSGLGRYVRKNFLFSKDLEEYNWLANYENSFFDVNVDISISSAQLLMET